MNTLILITTLLVSSAAFATDWQSLINLAPSLKKENISMDSKGYIKADVVKMPSGKYRILGFTSFLAAKKPMVTLSVAPDTNLGDLCRDSVMFEKKFKAQLTVQTNPMITNSRPIFGLDLSSFENPVTMGPAKIVFEKKSSSWTLRDYDALAQSKGRLVTDYYEELMNAQLQQSSDGVLRMDLSNRNALACDLIHGKLAFSTTRIAEYEQGLPSKQNWVGFEQFTSIFQAFWKLQPQIADARLAPSQNELAEAVALGVITRRTDLTEEILKSPARMQKFLSAVKSDVQGLSTSQKTAIRPNEITDNWMMNSEYVKPDTETAKQSLIIGDEAVFVKFED